MPRRQKNKLKQHRKSIQGFVQIYRFAIVFCLIGISLFLTKLFISSFTQTSVLGEKMFLAKGDDSNVSNSSSGSGSSDSSGSGSSGSGSSGSSESKSSGISGSNDDSDDSSETSDSSKSESGSSDTKVISPNTGNTSTNSLNTFRRSSPTPDASEIEDELDIKRDQVEIPEIERIRARTKDGRQRIDITANGIKVRFERRDDRMIVKAEREDGSEVELEDDTLFKIDDRLAKNSIKVETLGTEFLIKRSSVSATTKFPLSVDLATNTLVVTTPAGQKAVTVLPDQAVQNMLAANVIDRIIPPRDITSSESAQFTSVKQIIRLGQKNGIPVYEITGIDNQRLLGFIPIAIEKTIEVSAQTNTIMGTKVSLLNQLLDLFSV
jgi:hypothetical protein